MNPIALDIMTPEMDTLATRTAYKWMPVIDRDSCTGCGLCVKSCESNCIGLVWDFATFQRPDECTSCDRCAEACRTDVIQMSWVKQSGNPALGRWCDQPEPAQPRPEDGNWFTSLFR